MSWHFNLRWLDTYLVGEDVKRQSVPLAHGQIAFHHRVSGIIEKIEIDIRLLCHGGDDTEIGQKTRT